MAETNASKDVWTAARLKLIGQLVSKGATFSEVAVEINRATGSSLTRNACIGKARRLGLSCVQRKTADAVRIPPLAAKGNYSSDGAVAGGILRRIKSKLNGDRAPVVALKVVHDAADLTPLYLSLNDLTRTSCRWTYDATPAQRIEDGLSFRYCGCESLPRSSYCLAHEERIKPPRQVIPPAERERRRNVAQALASKTRLARAQVIARDGMERAQ